jgi:hypothetical protein
MMKCLRLLAFFAVWLGIAGQAHAVCTITAFQGMTPSAMTPAPYTVSTLPAPVTTSVTLFLTVTKTVAADVCKGAFTLLRATSPVQMTKAPIAGPVALPYTITSLTKPVFSFGTASPQLAFTFTPAVGTNITASVNLSLTLTPTSLAGTPTAGSYFDPLTARVFNGVTPTTTLVTGAPQFSVSATVNPGCALSAPSNIIFDFTSDIVSGVPRGLGQSANFSVNCTAAAKIRLSSSAMVPAPAILPRSGFDNFINFTAKSSSGAGGIAAITTTGTIPAAATSPLAATLTGSNLPVNIKASLNPGAPLLPGNYSSVLHVFVDPSL